MATELPSNEQWAHWGINPDWHRIVRLEIDGAPDVEWSVLENGAPVRGTLVCVHGNPTWGYLWKDFLSRLSHRWRVIAVDQTGMGWSERSTPRTLADRVAELVAFCRQETSGPLVLVAHDWGGPVVLGAAASLDVEAVILGNTGVALPQGAPMPPLIATARRFVDLSCRRSPLFVKGTSMMTVKENRQPLNAPYRTAERRGAVADFVADIPLSQSDVSWAALERAADTLEQLKVPLLLVWGGADPVFNDRFLADLVRRAPHATVHRFPDVGHLVPLDAPMADIASRWLDDVMNARSLPVDVSDGADGSVREDRDQPDHDGSFVDITHELFARADDVGAAFTDASGTTHWRTLAENVDRCARLLVDAGLEKGDRVALLVPPGVELLEVAYGVWRAGGVVVIVDRGLGFRGMRRLLRGSRAKWVVGTPKTLAAAKVIGLVPDARLVCTSRFPSAVSLGAAASASSVALPRLTPDDLAAVVHTSGSTGPAKPVRYSHGALAAQRNVISESFPMSPEKGFVTSFAPFIILGPALGVPCVLPEGDITKPSELDFDRLAAAVTASQVDVAWLSPASARRIVETAAGRKLPMRFVMLAGAPIPAELAIAIAEVTGADVRSPWGMTEAMPLTDGRGALTNSLEGTLTGSPLRGATVIVLPIDHGAQTQIAGDVWGELAVRADWMFDGYEQQWGADFDASVVVDDLRFHRTGDLGYFDRNGALHQLGRVGHLLSLPSGNVPCVLIEQPLAAALHCSVAAVGVGPTGTQAIAVVVASQGQLRLGSLEVASLVRENSSFDIAAVLEGELPVDIRHQSKIKRDLLSVSVATFLAGR